jgi:3',5'-cyclic AMP phosphodiesterase CpdA
MVLEDANAGAVIVNGDLAHSRGHVSDYKQYLSLMQPLLNSGLPIHMTMGNHDDRANFWEILPNERFSKSTRIEALDSKQALAVDTPLARWIILDSLEVTHQTPGLLGPEPLAWLKNHLEAHPDKPALVMMHHDPHRNPAPPTQPASTQPASQPVYKGLKDTQALLDILLPRKQVKVLFFGHTHVWSMKKQDGLHLVNLPAVAYPFKASEPSGWVDCKLSDQSIHLQLRCVREHPKDKEAALLTWR